MKLFVLPLFLVEFLVEGFTIFYTRQVKMKYFYMLFLVFVVSCGGDKNTVTDNNNDATTIQKGDGITSEQAQSREDIFAIQRATEDQVTLTFNKNSSDSVEVSFKSK